MSSVAGAVCLPAAVLLSLVAAIPHALAQTAQFSYADVTLGGGFSTPDGVAVDGSGNVYVADAANNTVKEMPVGCTSAGCVTTLGGGFFSPYGVAVDGSGNVYVADTGNGAVKEMPVGCASAGCVTTLGGGFFSPYGVAVDGSGNVYVTDAANNTVKEMPAGCTSASCMTTLGGGFSTPYGVAVDGSGNVYVADTGNSAVKEMPVGCTSVGCVTTLGGGFFSPYGVAVDGSGNVYVADGGNNAVKEMPVGCASAGCVTTVADGFFDPYGAAVDGSGNVYVADTGNSAVKEIMRNGVNFLTVPIGSTSAATTLTFTYTGSGTAGAPAVLTMGAANLDFTDAGTGSCTTNGASYSYTAGDICTVDVTFTPKYAGLRRGAVNLLSSSGAVIATAYVYGVGSGPQVAYDSNATTTLGGNTFESQGSVGVDGSGNVYVADTFNNVVMEIPAGCANFSCVTTLGSGFHWPYGVAVDGSGNVYVADTYNSAVKEMPAGCTSSSCVTTLGGGFSNPTGVSVDGSGNVYVADTYNSAVKEMPSGCTSPSCVTTLGGGFNQPWGATVDGSGNVYVADTYNSAVKEMPSGCTSPSCVTTLGGGFSNPTGVAVDGSGNVYVADTSNQAVKEMPSGCTSSSCVTTLGGFGGPTGVTVDGNGNVYVMDNGSQTVTEIDRSTPPSLNFASAIVGSTSSDSPRAVTLLNIGNAPLTFPAPSSGLNPSLSSTDFTLGSGTCPQLSFSSSAGTLAAGASCTLSVSFTPQSESVLSDSLVLTDNNLNVANGVQSIPLSGTGILPLTATTAIASTMLTMGQTGVNFTPVTGSGGTAPLSYAIAGTLPPGLSFSTATGTITGAPTAASSATTYTVTVTDANSLTATANFALTVNPDTSTISFSVPNHVYGDAPFTVSASSSSTGAFRYTVVGGPATVKGNTVTLTGAGRVEIQASQAADSNYAANTTTATFTVSASAISLTANSASILYGTASTGLSATVGYPGVLAPGGAITFTVDGGTAVAMVCSGTGSPLTCTAVYPTGSLAVGVHTVAVSEAADANYTAASATATLTVTAPPDFTFQLGGTQQSQTVASGGAASFNFQIAPQNGLYPATVSFAVAGLPPGATYTMTPSSIAQNGGPQTVTLNIQTLPTLAKDGKPSTPWQKLPVMAVLLLPFCLRRKMRGVLRAGVLAMLLVAGAAAIGSLTGCGGGNGFLQQPPTTYNIVVTATCGTVQHTETVVLNVQ